MRLESCFFFTDLPRALSCAHSLHCLTGDVYVFIKFKSSLSGPVPHVFVWKGAHSTSIPLLAWTRSIRCNSGTLLRSAFDSSSRTLKAATRAKHGRFGTYQIMAQGCETPEFVALFPAYFVVYEGRLASMFSPSPGTLKHQRARQKSLGSNIFLVLHPPLFQISQPRLGLILCFAQVMRLKMLAR